MLVSPVELVDYLKCHLCPLVEKITEGRFVRWLQRFRFVQAMLRWELLGDKVISAPNMLSYSRLLLGMINYLMFLIPGLGHAAQLAIISVVSVGAGVSDQLDGSLARKRKKTTTLGELVDPMFDKIYVGLSIVGCAHGLTPMIFIPVIVLEVFLFIVPIAALIFDKKNVLAKKTPIKSTIPGKTKFALEVFALSFAAFSFGRIADVLLAGAFCFGLWSMKDKKQAVLDVLYRLRHRNGSRAKAA